MMMPGRQYSAGMSYRYGFNGQENDNEVKGEGNFQDYGMRPYDPRIGKLIGVDPLSHEYPWYTPYQFAGNDVIRNIDYLGMQPRGATRGPGRNGRIVSYIEEAATNTGRRLIEGGRIQRDRELREQYLRETRLGIRTQMQRTREGIRNYLNNAFISAQNTFGGGNQSVQILKNQFNGSSFEKDVYQAMMKNLDYKNVVRQVTFVVESNGGTTVRVRVDNVGVRKDGSLDLVEAKFSIYEITANNVSRTLTINQKDFFNMVINGDVAKITFVGGSNKAAQIGSLSGTDVTGKIRDIQIVPSASSSATKTTTNSTKTTSQQPE